MSTASSPSTEQETAVTVERRGHVLLMGLNRPAKRNAFNLAMIDQLARAYYELEHDEDLRCGVLFAHGEHFTGGLDLAEVGPLIREGRLDFSGTERRDPWRKDGTWTTPVVAAVQGWVMTLAIELLLAADIRIAAANSRFAQMEINRGIYAFGGASMELDELTHRAQDERSVVPHRDVAAVGQQPPLDASYLPPQAGGVTGGGQHAIELRRGEQDRTGDAVEVRDRQCAVGAQRGDHLLCDGAAQRRDREIDGFRRRDALAVAHDVAERHVPDPGTGHDFPDARCECARDADLAREEAGQPPGLAVTVGPAARRREGDDRARPPALGQFERQRTSHRVSDDVCAADAELIEVALEIGRRWRRASAGCRDGTAVRRRGPRAWGAMTS